ncbi:hypothetical protein BMETH_2431213401794, partial [methanotrophic bacterial endosymbiont of Bathymodiolus sp.]
LTYPQAQRVVSISLYMFILFKEFRGRNLLKNKIKNGVFVGQSRFNPQARLFSCFLLWVNHGF